MKFLAIDCSQEFLVVVGFNGEKTAFRHITDSPFKHSVNLLDAVEDVLCQLKMEISQLDFIGCVIGAGSFTGIRIGIATVKGFCAPFNVKALPITAFSVMAYTKQKGSYMSVIDAKHDNYYVCGYIDGQVVVPPNFVNKEEFERLKSGYSLLSYGEINGYKTEIVNPVEGLINACFNLADNLIEADLLSPLYLRASQAEEGRQ